MISQFKIWAAASIQKTWTWDMEKFIQSKNPKTHQDLERAIQEYQEKISNA